MALYDGFFDAVLDDDGEYDRAYASGDFTTYFAQIIGSGVCVYGNENSFRVRMAGGNAVVSPGYLFIDGYWLKNDEDYTVTLPGSGTYAIAAKLNTGARMIELVALSVAQSYPDALVLAIVNTADGTAEDTRYNTDICGVIDSAGSLSDKVEYAVNYIDNEIEGKLAAAEQAIAAQSARLDAKIAEVEAQVAKLAPPPIGTIKFSASQAVDGEWLRCDGSFINEADYPELVAALGKLTPSGDKFTLLSDGEIGAQISNGVIFEGRMWVYSYATQKLYGVDLEGDEPIKEIAVTSEDANFQNAHPPTTQQPIALSIVKSPLDGTATLFLAQIISDSSLSNDSLSGLWIYTAAFSSSDVTCTVAKPFSQVEKVPWSTNLNYFPQTTAQGCVPYVASNVESGEEVFCCFFGREYTWLYRIKWSRGSESAKTYAEHMYQSGSAFWGYGLAQRSAYSTKNKDELVWIAVTNPSTSTGKRNDYSISLEKNTFQRGESAAYDSSELKPNLSVANPINIVGMNKILFEMSTTAIMTFSLTGLTKADTVKIGLSLPNAARIFVDGAAYLWGKDIYMIFVGTGIIFSRTLEEGSFGYLDTTSVLGTITQFGYLDYSQDEGTLYLLGQDTTNKVKVAKIVLNTLYDYANDGAWLPMIASDGVPAYIKATADEDQPTPSGGTLMVTTEYSTTGGYSTNCVVEFNGETLTAGTRSFSYPEGTGNATITLRSIAALTRKASLSVNGTTMATLPSGSATGETAQINLNVAPYMVSGLNLTVYTSIN